MMVITCSICCGFLIYLAILLEAASAQQWQVGPQPLRCYCPSGPLAFVFV